MKNQTACHTGPPIEEAILEFGLAVTSADRAQERLLVSPLADFDRHVACLGERQTEDLEGAILFGFAEIAQSLQRVGGRHWWLGSRVR